MLTFSSCSVCARHVKSHERACPFCGVALGMRDVEATVLARRTSRGEWLARGSALVLAGCSGAGLGGQGPDASAIDASGEGGSMLTEASEASEAGSVAASSEASAAFFSCSDGGPSVALGPEVPFTCPPADWGQPQASCDRRTQYCAFSGGGFACVPIRGICAYGGDLSCDSGVFGCNCLPRFATPCTDDGSGAVATDTPCYGAPPARLERLAVRGTPVA